MYAPLTNLAPKYTLCRTAVSRSSFIVSYTPWKQTEVTRLLVGDPVYTYSPKHMVIVNERKMWTFSGMKITLSIKKNRVCSCPWPDRWKDRRTYYPIKMRMITHANFPPKETLGHCFMCCWSNLVFLGIGDDFSTVAWSCGRTVLMAD